MDATKTDGHIWVMPRHFDISCTHYRTDLDIAKAPETWDEFKQQALDITKANPGVFGTQFAGKEEALSGRFYEVMTAEGGNLFNDKWEPTFNEAPGVKAATMFADLYKAKAMPPDMTNFLWEDVAKQFAAGLIGMYTEWHGWYGFFQDPKSSKVAGKFDIARQPKGDGGIYSGWAGHHGFSITKVSKEKAMAADLIKHLTSVEGNELEGKLGILVSRQSVWDKMIKEAATSTDPLAKKRLEAGAPAGEGRLQDPAPDRRVAADVEHPVPHRAEDHPRRRRSQEGPGRCRAAGLRHDEESRLLLIK